jgi:hypothetical protein
MSIVISVANDSVSFTSPVGCEQGSQFLPVADREFAEHYIPEIDQHLCDRCLPSYTESVADQAEFYAREACTITALPSNLDKECTKAFGRWPCDASRSQFTAFLLACRSRCTNYDDLVRPFVNDRDSVASGIFSAAIEREIDNLLTDEARIRGVAAPVESGRKPRTVFVADVPAKHANRLCG